MKPHLAIDRYEELKKSGLDTFAIIQRLRQEFVLSIGQAKEIMVCQETGKPLEEYQGRLRDSLIRVFNDAHHAEPQFEIDDEVETHGKQNSFRRGVIRDRIWHHNDNEWHYYLFADGKKVSKRYCSTDLRRTIHNEQTDAGNRRGAGA